MARASSRARSGRADAVSLGSLGAGALLLGLAVACGDAGKASGSESGVAGAKASVADAELPQGRSFLDATSPGPTGPTTAALKAAASGVAPKGPKIPGLAGFTPDPSRLTPEALAKNPLVMGVEKRDAFVLPEGADPLDPKSYGWDKDEEGHWIINYGDLSLEDVDKEMLLDALVYPEEYEDEDIHFPDRIRALDGEKVALTGYMIASEWEKKYVRSFMLVRDLMACCFGGDPEADEWIDVMMVGEKGAPYIQYVPATTRGIFRIQGVADEAGYATGAFQMEATDVTEE